VLGEQTGGPKPRAGASGKAEAPSSVEAAGWERQKNHVLLPGGPRTSSDQGLTLFLPPPASPPHHLCRLGFWYPGEDIQLAVESPSPQIFHPMRDPAVVTAQKLLRDTPIHHRPGIWPPPRGRRTASVQTQQGNDEAFPASCCVCEPRLNQASRTEDGQHCISWPRSPSFFWLGEVLGRRPQPVG